MGVPSLFRWLQLSHKETIHNVNENLAVDNLYLDFNAIIHTCVKPGLEDEEETEKDLYGTVGDFIDYVLAKVRPRKLLYIAVDGVAPRAKLGHQRARRYKSALGKKDGKAIVPVMSTGSVSTETQRRKDSGVSDVPVDDEFTGESSLYDKFVAEDFSGDSETDTELGKFDLNSITPGTPFMERLHRVLIAYIQYKLSTDPSAAKLKIIYSSYLVAGEGEQKIMSFIRNQAAARDDIHMIYSPDGDLIFLGLSLHRNKILIMRDYYSYNKGQNKKNCSKCGKSGHSNDECGVFTNYNFIYVDMYELKARLVREFRRCTTYEFNAERMINDWIFLCFLLGNDFVPSLPCLEIRFHSIETLTEILMKNFSETRTYITSGKCIDYRTLKNFYCIMAGKEDGLYYRKSQSLDRFREELKNGPCMVYEKIPIHTKAGKVQYYASKLKASTDAEIKKICYEYIRGLSWIYSYYILGITGWDWHYPHHFAPLAADLSKLTVSEISIPTGFPLRPLEQLLVVLPPMSRGMLPMELQPIFDEYKEYYPDEVETDMFDKVHVWQEVVLLPSIDTKHILSENLVRFGTLAYEDLSRNMKGSDLLFMGDKKCVETVLGMYSGLKPGCSIRSPGYSGVLGPYASADFPGDMLEYNGNRFVNKTVVGTIESNK